MSASSSAKSVEREFTFPHGVGMEHYTPVVNYSIHDNGGSPYRVEVDKDKKRLSIFMRLSEEENEDVESEKYLTSYEFSDIWIGIDVENPQWQGNTILFREKTSKRYIWIGNRGILRVFIPPSERIITLFSPVGNNDVTYAYAVGHERIYLLLENESVATSDVSIDSLLPDIYEDRCAGTLKNVLKMETPFVIAERDCPWTGQCVIHKALSEESAQRKGRERRSPKGGLREP